MSKPIEAGCLALIVEVPGLPMVPGNAGRVVLVVRPAEHIGMWWIDGMDRPLNTVSRPSVKAVIRAGNLKRIDGGDLSADDITEINQEEPSHATA